MGDSPIDHPMDSVEIHIKSHSLPDLAIYGDSDDEHTSHTQHTPSPQRVRHVLPSPPPEDHLRSKKNVSFEPASNEENELCTATSLPSALGSLSGLAHADLPEAPGRFPTDVSHPAPIDTALTSLSSPQTVTSPSSPDSGASSREDDPLPRVMAFSLWDYLHQEIYAVETDADDRGIRSERVSNFLSVPAQVEKIILFGFVVCMDSFLYTFTILPLRALVALYYLTSHIAYAVRNPMLPRPRLNMSHKCDLCKVFLIVATVYMLHHITDTGKMYHSVRGQDSVKLYVLFNVLEVADRLCSSFGQDLEYALFSRKTLERKGNSFLRILGLLSLNLACVVVHTLVLFYQLTTLNVTVNYFSNMLLTLLLSNQFVEIKGSVFKKFEKENLFQITCADIVERYQLSLMLFIIALRNIIELSSTTASSLFSFLPSAFRLSIPVPSLPAVSLLISAFSPFVIVILCECLVDWLKHAFITKFNHIRPAIYGRFIDVLCRDFVVIPDGDDDPRTALVDQSPHVARRLGFASLPLACLVLRVLIQSLQSIYDETYVDSYGQEGSPAYDWINLTRAFVIGLRQELGEQLAGGLLITLLVCIGFASLVLFKLLLAINLRHYATKRYASMQLRAQEDALNDKSRMKIGTTVEETKQDRDLIKYLKDMDDPLKSSKTIPLTELGRYDMVRSRVW